MYLLICRCVQSRKGAVLLLVTASSDISRSIGYHLTISCGTRCGRITCFIFLAVTYWNVWIVLLQLKWFGLPIWHESSWVLFDHLFNSDFHIDPTKTPVARECNFYRQSVSILVAHLGRIRLWVQKWLGSPMGSRHMPDCVRLPSLSSQILYNAIKVGPLGNVQSVYYWAHSWTNTMLWWSLIPIQCG